MHTTYEIVPEKLIYYFAPKCASRTVLGYLYYLTYKCIPEKEILFLIRENIKSTRTPTSLYQHRMCIVRDPVMRFISAYDNHINNGIDRFDAEYITVDKIIEHIDDPEFTKKNSRFMYYIQPQINFYGRDSSEFTDIFSIRNMNDVKSFIENISGETIPKIHLNRTRSNESTILNSFQVNWIKQRYHLDYEIYGKWM